MRLGYFTLADNPTSYGPLCREPNRFLLDLLEEAVLADELGFSSVWLPEHHFGLFGCLPTPAVYLAHLAARTKRVRLAPGTVVLPLNHPLRVAEEYASLDLLSGGRAMLSVGRGYDHREYGAFGVPIGESRERFDEGLALRRALSPETCSSLNPATGRNCPARMSWRTFASLHPRIFAASRGVYNRVRALNSCSLTWVA